VTPAPRVARIEVRDAALGGPPGVAVAGEVDMSTAPVLEEAIDAAVRASGGAFVVDLSDVDFLDSSGVNVLMRARSLLGREDRAIVLVCPPGPVLRVLQVVGIDGLFATFDSPAAAAGALVPKGQAR
jgi:anti-sigma B factor antagonist